jgi:hypothetical protein
MKTIAPIKNYQCFSFRANIVPRVPLSGFDLSFGSTGEAGNFTTGVRFYGRSGMAFDQSGNFFGGYYSGRSLDIEGHFFGDRLSYFCNGVLVNNDIPIVNSFNAIEFDKFGDSQLSLELNYVSGLVPEETQEGIQDINGIFLISYDNLYILPNI